MYAVEFLLLRSVFYSILAAIDFCLLLGSYGFLRLLRVSANVVTWLIGGLIILASVLQCLAVIFSQQFVVFNRLGNLLGALSFLIAVYTAGQWIMRQWFIQVKKRTKSSIVPMSKNALLFLRAHHQFFGWVVASAALAHFMFYLPVLSRIRVYEVITGFITLGILAVAVLLGVWMWFQTRRRQRISKVVHTIHASLTVAFFVALFVHM